MTVPSGALIGTGVEAGSAVVAAIAVPVKQAVLITASEATATVARRSREEWDIGE